MTMKVYAGLTTPIKPGTMIIDSTSQKKAPTIQNQMETWTEAPFGSLLEFWNPHSKVVLLNTEAVLPNTKVPHNRPSRFVQSHLLFGGKTFWTFPRGLYSDVHITPGAELPALRANPALLERGEPSRANPAAPQR